MDLYAVKVEISDLLKTITGLRAYPWPQSPVVPPAAIIGWPDSIDYTQSYGGGQTRVPDLPVLVVVGLASARIAAKRLGEFMAESGAKSIPAKLESRTGSWVACDALTVNSANVQAITLAGVDYAAAEFHLDITGRGRI